MRCCHLCKRRHEKDTLRSYHKFPPIGSEKRLQWFQIICMPPVDDRFIYLCSEHFSKSDYYIQTNGRKALTKNALPVLTPQYAGESDLSDDEESDLSDNELENGSSKSSSLDSGEEEERTSSSSALSTTDEDEENQQTNTQPTKTLTNRRDLNQSALSERTDVDVPVARTVPKLHLPQIEIKSEPQSPVSDDSIKTEKFEPDSPVSTRNCTPQSSAAALLQIEKFEAESPILTIDGIPQSIKIEPIETEAPVNGANQPSQAGNSQVPKVCFREYGRISTTHLKKRLAAAMTKKIDPAVGGEISKVTKSTSNAETSINGALNSLPKKILLFNKVTGKLSLPTPQKRPNIVATSSTILQPAPKKIRILSFDGTSRTSLALLPDTEDSSAVSSTSLKDHSASKIVQKQKTVELSKSETQLSASQKESNRKRWRTPRYFGECVPEDIDTPHKAKLYWHIAEYTVSFLRKRLRNMRIQNGRLKKKVDSYKAMIEYMTSKENIKDVEQAKQKLHINDDSESEENVEKPDNFNMNDDSDDLENEDYKAMMAYILAKQKEHLQSIEQTQEKSVINDQTLGTSDLSRKSAYFNDDSEDEESDEDL